MVPEQRLFILPTWSDSVLILWARLKTIKQRFLVDRQESLLNRPVEDEHGSLKSRPLLSVSVPCVDDVVTHSSLGLGE